jgi:hypothetical protein
MASSVMLCCVDFVITDISKEFSASIIRVTRIGDLRTMLTVTRNGRTYARPSFHLVPYKRCDVPGRVEWIKFIVVLPEDYA